MRLDVMARLRHLPILIVIGWWILDLQVHWRTLVEFQHGWLVFPLAAYLAWERAPGRPPSTPPASARGPMALAILSMPAVLVAQLYKEALASTATSSFLMSLGCVGFLMAMIWLLHGLPVAKRFLLPVLFVFVAVPIPKTLWNPIVLGLQGLITSLNVEALNLLGIPAERSGNLIRLPGGTVGVDEACSGIRSLQASIMAAVFIADLTLRRGGTKVFFLLAGIALAIAGNFGRSMYLSLTAARRGVGAVAAVHDTAGWSVLGFTAAGLAVLAWLIARLEKRAAQPFQP
jgi:exosortase